MNRQAFVIGNTITMIVTIIAIIFIMGTFVLVASGISLIKKPDIEKSSTQFTEKDEFLLSRIIVESKSGQKTEMFVYDAITLWLKGDADKLKVYDAIATTLTPQKDCYFLIKENDERGFDPDSIYQFKDGKATRVPLSIELFLDISKVKSITINNQQIKIRYYYGKCPL